MHCVRSEERKIRRKSEKDKWERKEEQEERVEVEASKKDLF